MKDLSLKFKDLNYIINITNSKDLFLIK